MRYALFCVLMLAVSRLPARATDMTVIMEFDGPYSQRTVDEMKRETQEVVKGANLKLDWQLKDQAGQNAYADLVVVRFKGKCIFQPAPYLYDERGPLAFTYSTSGEVQPYGEVSCDNVARTIQPAMDGGEYAKGDQLMGRAMGRVLAHELMHMMTKSRKHGRSGAGKAALSAQQLIADELPLDPADINRLASPVKILENVHQAADCNRSDCVHH